MGPGGLVMLNTLNQSKLAAQSANEEIQAMPPAIQGVAKAYMDGSISAKAFNQEIFSGPESARDKALLSQFQTTASNALGFSAIVKSGLGDKQTVAAALNEALGGQVGSQVAMLLGGSHAPTTTSDVSKVQQAAKENGPDVQGWSEVQKTLKFQLGSAEQGLESAVTQIGKVFLPAATGDLKDIAGVAKFFAGNPGLTKDLAEAGAGLGALLGAKYVGGKAAGAAQDIGKMLGLGNVGKTAGLDSAASGLSGAAGALQGAAGSLEGAAGALKGEPPVTGTPAAAGEGEAAGAGAATAGAKAGGAAAAEGEGAAGLTAGSLFSGLQKVLGPAAIATWVDQVAKDEAAKVAPKIHAPQAKPDSTGSSVAEQVGQNVMTQLPVLGPTISALEGLFGVKPGKPTATPHSDGTPAPVTTGRAAALGDYGGAPQASPRPYFAPAPSGIDQISPGGHPAAVMPAALPSAPDLLGTGGHPSVKITVDTSAIDAAKAKVQSDIVGLGGHPSPVKLPAPDISAIAGAKSQVQADIAGMGGHPAPIRLPAPDLSALAAAKGTAAADGAAVGAGFATGIASETGAAAAAGASLASAAEAAMKVHLQISSPSKVGEKIGANLDAGFTQGITGNTDSVKAASAEIGSASIASLLQGLAGGQTNVQNAIQAVMGAAANPDAVTSIQQTIQTLIGDVPAKDTGLVTYLTGQQAKLTALADKQGAVEAQISNAHLLLHRT